MNHGKVVLKNSDFKTFSWGRGVMPMVLATASTHTVMELAIYVVVFLISSLIRLPKKGSTLSDNKSNVALLLIYTNTV